MEEEPKKALPGVYLNSDIVTMLETGKLTATQAILWAIIRTFHTNHRECFATNSFLGIRLGLHPRRIQALLVELKDMNLLQISNRKEETARGLISERRYLSAIEPYYPSDPMLNIAPPHAKYSTPPCYPQQGGDAENSTHKNTNNKNTNLTPPRGREVYVTNSSEPHGESSDDQSPITAINVNHHPRWKAMAQQLASAISQVHKVNSSSKTTAWALDIAKVNTVDKIDRHRIQLAMDWYCRQYPISHQDQYFLVINSGKTFREKFLRLEAAMIRQKEEDGDGMDPMDNATGPTITGTILPEGTKLPLATIYEMYDGPYDKASLAAYEAESGQKRGTPKFMRMWLTENHPESLREIV